MRAPAPPYRGEGPHALWHVSEDVTLERFVPHVSRTATSSEPRVWAVDTRHLPLYWFPRDCPRGAFWARADTTREDRTLLNGASRVHLVERRRLSDMCSARVVAYRLPEDAFEPDPEVGGYWLSRSEVEPLDVVELGELTALHDRSGIELRPVDDIWPSWDRIASSTLEFSGIRLRNAVRGDS